MDFLDFINEHSDAFIASSATIFGTILGSALTAFFAKQRRKRMLIYFREIGFIDMPPLSSTLGLHFTLWVYNPSDINRSISDLGIKLYNKKHKFSMTKVIFDLEKQSDRPFGFENSYLPIDVIDLSPKGSKQIKCEILIFPNEIDSMKQDWFKEKQTLYYRDEKNKKRKCPFIISGLKKRLNSTKNQ